MTDLNMTPRSAHDRRQRRILIGIALMFFAPLALCFYLYYGHVGWRPGGRVNAGELIEPPRPLPSLSPLSPTPLGGGTTAGSRTTYESGRSPGSPTTDANLLKRKWTFLYAISGPCAAACRARLYDTRQVRLALDRDMTRVQRVLIAGADCCDAGFLREQHPDLITVQADAATAPLLALLPGFDSSIAPGSSGAHTASTTKAAGDTRAPLVYVVDPLGNLMMFYAPEVKSKGMLDDMKRLLRLSSIG